MNIQEDIKNIAEKYYKSKDKSHDFNHILQVVKWCDILTLKYNLDSKETLIALTIAYFHDSYDHKYYNKVEISKIKKNIIDDLIKLNFNMHDINNIILVIDNISFSKELKNRKLGINMDLGEIQKIRDIVSDADKLESLGINGIIRMIYYENEKLSKLNLKKSEYINLQIDHIIEHSQNNLFKLVSDNFIRTTYAKKIGETLINEMKQILNDNDKLFIMINEIINTF